MSLPLLRPNGMRSTVSLCRQCLVPLESYHNLVPRPKINRRWVSYRPKPDLRTVRNDEGRRTASSLGTQAQASMDADPYNSALYNPSGNSDRLVLQPDNLVHSFSDSPSAPIRRRAAYMKQHAYCPHPKHQRTRQAQSPSDPENRKPAHGSSAPAIPPAHVNFECPDCKMPVYCCEEHWMDDYESHLEICDTLKQINEDDHDLRSGRFFPEFNYPDGQRDEEFVLNMSNWDTLLYTRDFKAIDEPRNMRQVTRLLTYPLTIASILHELSPYSIRSGGRLTNEGLRSFSGQYMKQQTSRVVC